jgi:hypothetical protein
MVNMVSSFVFFENCSPQAGQAKVIKLSASRAAPHGLGSLRKIFALRKNSQIIDFQRIAKRINTWAHRSKASACLPCPNIYDGRHLYQAMPSSKGQVSKTDFQTNKKQTL